MKKRICVSLAIILGLLLGVFFLISPNVYAADHIDHDGHTFEECKKVLEYMGFTEKSSKGSHHKFQKEGLNRPFILAKHHPIDPGAIDEILNFYNKEI